MSVTLAELGRILVSRSLTSLFCLIYSVLLSFRFYWLMLIEASSILFNLLVKAVVKPSFYDFAPYHSIVGPFVYPAKVGNGRPP